MTDMKKNKNQYVQANRDWLVAKSQEDGMRALPKGVYYRDAGRERPLECDAHARQCDYRPLHGMDYRRQAV